jgi:8-hydroxy-5-deazaflavin:NADPH oxidoreductase
MRVGILGSGLMGSKLGTTLACSRDEAVFSYSCGQEKLQRLARETEHARGCAT